MKIYITSLLLLLFVQQLAAATFYDQLCEFNFNWKKYESRAPLGEAMIFESDQAYVYAHLSSVLPILRTNPANHLTKAQFSSRMHLIEVLDGYRIARRFPINYHRTERIPVFVDDDGTHCAVAYLLQQTGNEEIVLRLAKADNYAWVKDIHDEAVLVWQQASGLSMEELKLIQGAYDSYMPFAFTGPNKYEIPQKPEQMIAYFEHNGTKQKRASKEENIWCYGEGKDGVLNGRWEQNYAVGIPWIEGYYNNGNRTGQWKEYYQGTDKLCRTENWRNDKLNGIRKRFNRKGVLIEEILFKDGVAVTKTNYDLQGSLRWVRKPLDSNVVWTQVFTFGGALIASGNEKVHNPGKLLWFQNIELTALNSFSITSRDEAVSYQPGHGGLLVERRFGRVNLFSSPPLVEYKKEGDWIYYREFGSNMEAASLNSMKEMLGLNYRHFGLDLFQRINLFGSFELISIYDSIQVVYNNDRVYSFHEYGVGNHTHLKIRYHDPSLLSNPRLIRFYDIENRMIVSENQIKEMGLCNLLDEQIGVWKHFNEQGELYKTERFIIPWKEEELEVESSDRAQN